jgi:hypothetical protein
LKLFAAPQQIMLANQFEVSTIRFVAAQHLTVQHLENICKTNFIRNQPGVAPHTGAHHADS